MANTLNITSSLEPVVDTTSVVGAQTYTESAIDKNTGALGGLYKSLTYTATKAVKYSGVVSATGFTVLASAFEANNAVGAAPGKVKAIGLSFDSALGSPGTVDLEISIVGTIDAATYNAGGGADATGSATITQSLVIARLSVGESVVIPLSNTAGGGLAVAQVKIKNAAYVDDTTEATVSAVLLGAA
tara:strand:- start:477 stop:1037 length:561 start_codon:yes stop_codon:yes gene_type:complete